MMLGHKYIPLSNYIPMTIDLIVIEIIACDGQTDGGRKSTLMGIILQFWYETLKFHGLT